MARLGDRSAPSAVDAFSAAASPRQQSVQLASNGSCTSCHGGEPPPPMPPLPRISLPSLPPLSPLPPLLPPGAWGTLLPPPLGGLVAAGRLAGILSGSQKSEYRRSGGRPPPPSGASGDPYEWSSKPECTEQYNSDLAVCRSDHAPPGCFSRTNERLANCNQGKIDFPPLWEWPPRS
jgi:hypothetical protein